MADNRMYIKCDVCGGKVMLAKHHLVGWFYPGTISLSEHLEAFLEKHWSCESDDKPLDRYRDHFSLAYEFSSDPTRELPVPPHA